MNKREKRRNKNQFNKRLFSDNSSSHPEQIYKKFERKKLRIAATRDWHPENHISFREREGIWTKHCGETKGAEFHKDLRLPKNTIIISKATEPEKRGIFWISGHQSC